MEYEYAVLIGRFQPFHKIHLDLVRGALDKAEELILVIGSACSARSVKNPFTFEERKEMISAELDALGLWHRVHIVGIRDYYYNENAWVTDVQRQVQSITLGDIESIAILGSYKDSSSYYINLFQQWDTIYINSSTTLNSTDIREVLFTDPEHSLGWSDRGGDPWGRNLPNRIRDWIINNFVGTEACKMLQAEHKYLKDYKKSWEAAPYLPTFVTADTVVIKSGHVLVVRRRVPPGRDTLALPGGFIKVTEYIKDGALRELKEETRIQLSKEELELHIVGTKVFDHPTRSLRGRTITHVYHIDLGIGDLPIVKAGDDARGAFWMPLMDLGKQEDKFFEDHAHMIFNFINGSK